MNLLISLLFIVVNAMTLISSVRQGDWLWAALAAACLFATLYQLV